MKRKLLGRMALAAAAIAASAAVGTGRASAEMRVVSSDITSRFMALGVSKSVVIELSTDVKSVVVADRTIATAVALSKRRVEISGQGLVKPTSISLMSMIGRSTDSMSRSRTRRNLMAWKITRIPPASSWSCMAG